MNDHSAGDNENRVEFFENATEIVMSYIEYKSFIQKCKSDR